MTTTYNKELFVNDSDVYYFIPLAQSHSNLICNQLSSKYKETNSKVIHHDVLKTTSREMIVIFLFY